MTSKRRLIVHAGTHKTGTTAIQKAMGLAASKLRQQGIYWPVLRSHPNHHTVALGLAGRGRLPALHLWLIRQRLRHPPAGCHTVVLSSEKFYRMGYEFFEGADQAGEIQRGRREAFLDDLARFLTGFDVSVVLYLRRVDEFAESLFKELQFRKDYAGRFTFEDFLAQQTVLFDYAAQIEELERYVGPVEIVSYQRASETGLIADFCARIGAAQPERADTSQVVRRSPSNSASRFLALFGEKLSLDYETRRKVFAFCLSDAWQEAPGGRHRSLWPAEASHRRFLEVYGAPELVDLFPPVEWSAIDYEPMGEAEFRLHLDRFEAWEAARHGSAQGSGRTLPRSTGSKTSLRSWWRKNSAV